MTESSPPPTPRGQVLVGGHAGKYLDQGMGVEAEGAYDSGRYDDWIILNSRGLVKGWPMHRMEIESIRAPEPPKLPDLRMLLLRSAESGHHLQIGMGPSEAEEIHLAFSGFEAPWTRGQDLLKSVVETTGGEVQQVVITELSSGVFHAEITLQHSSETSTVDARPSEAIGLALRCDVPIFATDEVIEQAGFEVEPVIGVVAVTADGDGRLEADGGSGISDEIQIDANHFRRLGLQNGDRVIGHVGAYPGRTDLQLVFVDSVNGRVPTATRDLSNAEVPVKLVTPDVWYAHGSRDFSPFGLPPGALTIWANQYEVGEINGAQFLGRLVEESDGALELLEDDGSFELAPGFEATALTRTTRRYELGANPGKLLENFLSLDGAKTRWMIGIADERVIMVGLEAIDEERFSEAEWLLSEAQLTAGGTELGLTEREIEVLQHIADGETNPVIAERLSISPHTVARHVKSILAKMDAATRTQAAAYAVARGIIEGAGAVGK